MQRVTILSVLERTLAKHVCEKESEQDTGVWCGARVIYMRLSLSSASLTECLTLFPVAS